MQHTSAHAKDDVREEQRADDQKVAKQTELVKIACNLSIAVTMLDIDRASETNGQSDAKPSIDTVVGRGRDPNMQACAGLHGEYDGRRGAIDPNEPHSCGVEHGGCFGGACDETYEQHEQRLAKRVWVPRSKGGHSE